MSVHPYYRGSIKEEYAICSNCQHWTTPELSEPSLIEKLKNALGLWKASKNHMELFKKGKCGIRDWLSLDGSPIISPDHKSCNRISPIDYVASKSEVRKMLNNLGYEPVCVPKEEVSIQSFIIRR